MGNYVNRKIDSLAKHWKYIGMICRKGRKYCAALLCVSLIVGNLTYSSAADHSGTNKFELTREDLYEEIQKEYKAGNVLSGISGFSGENEELYKDLFEDGGTVYELHPEITKSGKGLKLRVFAKLHGEVALEYDLEDEEIVSDKDSPQTTNCVLNSEDEIIFLLTNKTAAAQSAIISIDGEPSGTIQVASYKEQEPEKEDSDTEVRNTTEVSAAILPHQAYRLMTAEWMDTDEETATASEAKNIKDSQTEDGENATFSSASPSDAGYEAGEIEFDEAELLDPVLLDHGQSAAALVITAGDLGLDQMEPEEETLDAAENEFRAFIEDHISVTVYAENDVLPEDAELQITEIAEEDEDSKEQFRHVRETMDESDTEYDGMLIYDISFRGKDESGEDEEVEPDGEVQVFLKVDNGILPEDADPDSIAVHHLREPKSRSTVKVEHVADAADETDGIVDVKEEGTYVEFGVDSFSYFVITYRTTSASISQMERKVYFVDSQGTAILGDKDTQISLKDYLTGTRDPANFAGNNIGKWLENKWVSLEALAGEYGSLTTDYTYVSSHLDSYDGTQIYWIYCQTKDANNKALTTDQYSWRYSDSTEQPSGSSAGTELTADNTIYMVFSPKPMIGQGDVQITDNIITDGTLTAVYTDYKGTASLTYKWYRSDNGEDNTWKEVIRRRVTGSSFNIPTEGGNILNAALDKGAEKWYKVEVYAGDITTDSKPIAVSNPYLVDYYSELKNGSFEEPDVNLINQTGNNYQYPNGTTGLIWKTTGKDQMIEIVVTQQADKSSSNTDSTYNCGEAVDGIQFAELNAEADGALYQDVLTVPGENLNYWLSHRGRKGEDTMYLVIAPTREVNTITTQADLMELISEINQGSHTIDDGYFLLEKTDGNTAWGSVSGSYTVAEDQYLTRFFFVAGNTASSNKTEGNFLDRVGFSSELPPADAGEGNLYVTKTVTGLAPEDIVNYQVEITVGDEMVTLDGSTDTFTENADGSYSATAGFHDLKAGQSYTVTEKVTDETQAKLETGYNAQSSSYLTKVAGNIDSTGTGTTTSVLIADQKNSNVTFTNAYSRKNVSLTVSKSVGGNEGEKNKDFGFTVMVDGKLLEETGLVSAGAFSLKDGESRTLAIPYGSEVLVQEDDYSKDGYTTSITVGEPPIDKRIWNTVYLSADTEVAFTNVKNVETLPETKPAETEPAETEPAKTEPAETEPPKFELSTSTQPTSGTPVSGITEAETTTAEETTTAGETTTVEDSTVAQTTIPETTGQSGGGGGSGSGSDGTSGASSAATEAAPKESETSEMVPEVTQSGVPDKPLYPELSDLPLNPDGTPDIPNGTEVEVYDLKNPSEPIYKGPYDPDRMNLPAGDYEIVVLNEEGVPLSSGVFAIEEDGVLRSEMLPKTGDNSIPLILPVILMVVCAVGILFLAVRIRKKEDQDQ